jgi:hypothetical protein
VSEKVIAEEKYVKSRDLLALQNANSNQCVRFITKSNNLKEAEN